MAALGPMAVRVPVALLVGDFEHPIGELEMTASAKQISLTTVDASIDSVDLRPQLSALLRAAADHIEQGVDNAPAHR